MAVLMTDPHVERAVMLLALMQAASNPVELARWKGQYKALVRSHPEVSNVLASDVRVTAKIQEIREAFEQPQQPVEACHKCGHLASNRIDAGDGLGKLPICGACLQKQNARKPSKRGGSLTQNNSRDYEPLGWPR